MSEWREVPLRSVTTKVGSGATPRGGKGAYVNEGISLIRSMNVLDGRFDMTDLARITEEQANRLANVVVEQDDILLNITGASVARCCLVPAEVLPARVNQHVAIIRLDRSAAVPGFVQGYLVSPVGKGRLLALAQGGATREALTKATIEGFTIPLPELLVQERVAEVLGALDALIVNNRRRIALLEQMAQAIYREWFVHFRYPGHEEHDLVDSSLGPIPAAWVPSDIDGVSSFVSRGIQPKYAADGGSTAINQRCIREGRIDFSRVRRQERAIPASKQVRFGDVLINSTGEGTLGRVAQLYKEVSGMTVDSHVTIARPAEGVNLEWFGLTLLGKRDEFAALAIGSTGQTELGREAVKSSTVIVPPEHVQENFGRTISPLRRMATVLGESALSLASIRDRLLPRLVTGVTDVSMLDLDALLEESRA